MPAGSRPCGRFLPAGYDADPVPSYEDSGVSLAAADAVVERLRAAADSTRTPSVVTGLGGFAGLFALDDERLLAASTDGVGTKLVLARRPAASATRAATSPRTA